MFSIVMPLDLGRFRQFAKTKKWYDAQPQEKEFLIPTRYYDKVAQYLDDKGLAKNVRLLPYSHKTGFNPAKALNLGVKHARFDNIIITSPEVIPKTPVLDQFATLLGKNVLAQVFDQNEDGSEGISLINRDFRSESPAMYFLALFNKSDIEKINGWDEAFMDGYAWEDNDFGARWNRAELPFEVRDEIQGFHQWHPRLESIPGGFQKNADLLEENKRNGVVRCKNGIIKE